MTPIKRRRALTIWEKRLICLEREKPEHAYQKLSDFGKLFLDKQGLPIPTSTLSDILKEKNKWLNLEVGNGGTWKKKQRKAQFPELEMHLVEWLDRANHKHVAVSDFVMKVAAESIVAELSKQVGHFEDYTDFAFSNGWLQRLKQRHALGGKKVRGEGGNVEAHLLPAMQQDLINQLEDFAIRDVYNCDELALQ